MTVLIVWFDSWCHEGQQVANALAIGRRLADELCSQRTHTVVLLCHRGAGTDSLAVERPQVQLGELLHTRQRDIGCGNTGKAANGSACAMQPNPVLDVVSATLCDMWGCERDGTLAVGEELGIE